MPMKAITLRQIPTELAEIIEREAQATGTSLNKTVLRLLEKATGVSGRGRRPGRFHDLDELAGSWSAKQAREFDRHLGDQRQLDPDIWE
jgi:hypothetical protein